jgi:hypothetical protein
MIVINETDTILVHACPSYNLSEKLAEPVAHAMVNPAEEMLVVKLVKAPIRLLLYAVLHQPDTGGIHGSVHHLYLPRYPDWHATPDRQAKYGLCQFDNATEQCRTAGKYDAGRHMLGVCTPHDFTARHF